MEKQYSPAVQILTKQHEVRSQIRDEWKRAAGEIIDSHQFAFSVLFGTIERFSGRRFEKQHDNLEGRMSLIAQFIQGIDVCEVAISEGLYSQAAALLKQELETIVAIDEFANGRRRDGRTPNVGNGSYRSMGPVYGDLNDIAHVAKADITRNLVLVEDGELVAPTLVPKYDSSLAKFLYGYHVFFIIEAAKQSATVLKELFGEGMTEADEQMLMAATLILLKHDVIKLPAEYVQQNPHVLELLNKIMKQMQ